MRRAWYKRRMSAGARPAPQRVTIDVLIERHEVLLLDAYGVLVHHGGALPGAPDLVRRLNASGKPYFILTNDASRLPSTSSARFEAMGLPIPEARVITSGSLIGGFLAARGLRGARCIVLGPEDSRCYVREAGGVPVGPEDPDASVVVVCDEVGYSFIDTVDSTLTVLIHRIDRGEPLDLVLPNPDLFYPKDARSFGVTAGSIACLLEAVLARRYPDRDDLTFTRLGKPNRPIFEEAARRAGTRDMVMVGDQLETDIRGALDFGIPAALAQGGLDRHDPAAALQPTYLLEALG